MLAGCTADLAEVDAAFYNWDDRVMHCAVEGDDKAGNDMASILTGLDRARDRGEVFELLVHQPGVSMSFADFETLLAAVNERGLAWVTYEDIARGIDPVAGIALQYDGTYVDQWHRGRDLLRQYNARVTIFVTRYGPLNAERKAKLRDLHDDGHDLEPHGTIHARSPVYVEEHGMRAFLANEVQPSIDSMRADGYEIVSYAYPFGDRTDEIDRAVGARVPLLRSLSISRALVTSPCPY